MFSEMSDRERQILYVKSKKLKQYIKKLKKTIYKNTIKLTDIRTNYSYQQGEETGKRLDRSMRLRDTNYYI